MFRFFLLAISFSLLGVICGCGTTRWSDTARTATEQLLISDAVDRAISQMDFSPLSGQAVYLDGQYIAGMVDEKYVMSTLRQHMLASGCVIKEKADMANYVVEVRAGAVGTNRNDMLLGVPATNLPGVFTLGTPTPIPELPLMKRTAQQGVCKVAVFAYDRASGQPVWQSGVRQQVSKAKDTWVFGTGPFQKGTIYQGTKFAGEPVKVPLSKDAKDKNRDQVWVTHEILFQKPTRVATLPVKQSASTSGSAADNTQASYMQPVTDTSPSMTPVPKPPVAPPPVTPPPSVITDSSLPNPAAGALGAYQMMDWARTVRGKTPPTGN